MLTYNTFQSATPTAHDIQRRCAEAAFGNPLVTNVLRGQVVEAIVACALEPDWHWCAADYSSWDFERPDGLRLEVKQSAAKQSWSLPGAAPSKASFDIASRKGRWEGADWIEEPGRAAHIYVFAYHPITEDAADHRDPSQWRFYVTLASALPGTQRISLATLSRLIDPVGFGGLAEAVEVAARDLDLDAAA